MQNPFRMSFKSRRTGEKQELVEDIFTVSSIRAEVLHYTTAATVQQIIHLTAERYVKENYAELVKNLDQDAIRAQVAIAVAIHVAKEMGR